jgi:hypothetical protein
LLVFFTSHQPYLIAILSTISQLHLCYAVCSISYQHKLACLLHIYLISSTLSHQDRFVFIGWSGLILFPTAYLALGAWLTGTTFVTSWFTHGLASSYLEGCNFITAALEGCGHLLQSMG